jgi:hypothetical protein
MANSESKEQKPLPPHLTRLHKATVEGFAAFKKELDLAAHLGYQLMCAWPIGASHFAVAYRLVDHRVGKTYDDFAGAEEFLE